ncbi:MAG TPA: proline iminopeptidase-family hydrolase [Chloroflexota bacterium]|nr:proline iminopeptidase-family hydrolase [Chloroflexota bacterium]
MAFETFPETEGTIPFHGYHTWYKIVGEGEEPGKYPLLALHGGPGATHDYMLPIAQLAGTGRRVIFYDQIGGGRSAIGESRPEMWTVDLFLEEVQAVRDALGLERVHVIGSSWGGMLGMEYALTHPAGLLSLIVSDSPASMHQWVAEANRLREELPPEAQQTLLAHEEAGTTDSAEYQEAMQEFYARHVCRVQPMPDNVARSFAFIEEHPEVYNTMNGPSEFHVIGTIKEWDITNRLGEIDVPTLVLSGRYDEATPLIAETVTRGIPGAEWVLFEESSHMPFVEETERYNQVVAAFLDRVESSLD